MVDWSNILYYIKSSLSKLQLSFLLQLTLLLALIQLFESLKLNRQRSIWHNAYVYGT